MKRGLIVIATLFSLTACSTQQVKEGAGYAVGTAVVTAATALALYGSIRDDLDDDCDQQCRAEKQRRAARREGAEERRAARRIAEINASLDAYLTAEPDIGTEQRSVVLVPDDLPVPQESVDRLDALLPEEEREN